MQRYLVRGVSAWLAFLILSVIFVQSVPAVMAAGPYIQLNNGPVLSISGSEQPQIVAQFGNTGSRINDVRVVCGWNNLIRFNGQVQAGPFPNTEVVVPGFRGLASLFYPNRSVTSAALLPDLPTGQNYNVSLGIRLALPNSHFTGEAGTIQCFLLDMNFKVLAESQPLSVRVRS